VAAQRAALAQAHQKSLGPNLSAEISRTDFIGHLLLANCHKLPTARWPKVGPKLAPKCNMNEHPAASSTSLTASLDATQLTGQLCARTSRDRWPAQMAKRGPTFSRPNSLSLWPLILDTGGVSTGSGGASSGVPVERARLAQLALALDSGGRAACQRPRADQRASRLGALPPPDAGQGAQSEKLANSLAPFGWSAARGWRWRSASIQLRTRAQSQSGAARRLHHCTGALLHCCTARPLHWQTTAPLHCCSAAQGCAALHCTARATWPPFRSIG